MSKILTWVKHHQYQWEREDFHKAFNVLWGSLWVILAGSIVTGLVLTHFGARQEAFTIAFAMWYLLLGLGLAGATTVKWADSKLKS